MQNNFLSNKAKQYHTFISRFVCFFCGGGGKAISALNNSIFKICNTKCIKINIDFLIRQHSISYIYDIQYRKADKKARNQLLKINL
jgi:hypothetical protein